MAVNSKFHGLSLHEGYTLSSLLHVPFNCKITSTLVNARMKGDGVNMATSNKKKLDKVRLDKQLIRFLDSISNKLLRHGV